MALGPFSRPRKTVDSIVEAIEKEVDWVISGDATYQPSFIVTLFMSIPSEIIVEVANKIESMYESAGWEEVLFLNYTEDGHNKIEIQLGRNVTEKEAAINSLKEYGYLWDGSKGYFARNNGDGTREVVELTDNGFSYISSYDNLDKVLRRKQPLPFE